VIAACIAGTLKLGVPLEDRQVRRVARQDRDGLHPRGPGADDPDPQPGHVDRFGRPLRGVQDPAGESGQAGQVRPLGRRQVADRPEQEARLPARARLGLHRPVAVLVVPPAAADPLPQVHVPAQIEPVGDVPDVTQDLRLGGVALRQRYSCSSSGEKA
jgi:hypothetical protein